MKKIISIILAFALLLGMTACTTTHRDWQEQYDLGMRYLEDGDYEQAVLAFSAAIEIDPNNPEAYMGRAEAYRGLGDLDKALKDYKRAKREAKNNDDFEDLLDELEELIEEKNQMLTAFENDINNKTQAIKEYEAEIKEQDELISALEAAVEAERKQILKQNGIVLEYDGGAFKFPVAKYTRVSSEFGWRIHPTLGYNKFHNGIDLASPSGTAIYAAYSGTVVAATYSSTMGNYVMINHGSGLYTIYMHASKLYVKKDDIVARGDTIAAVGSTGRSTGPHLHFGVRLNGEYVNPRNYILKK